MRIRLTSKKYGVKYLIIDDEDWGLIKKKKWTLICDKGLFYVQGSLHTNKGWGTIRLHRYLLNIKNPNIHVDHKDNNGLNNRRSNIRAATIQENSRNVGPTTRSRTGYKGVYHYPTPSGKEKYGVRIKNMGRTYFGGYFKNPKEAALKYNEMAKKHHGEFAYLNKIKHQ